MLERIVNKITSGRFLMTVAFTITTCWLALRGDIPVELFVPLVSMIVTAYFNRNKEVSK